MGRILQQKTSFLIAFIFFGAFALGSASASEPLPLEEGKFASAKECGSCHKEIYDMWKDSMHSKAMTDPIFRATFMEVYVASKGELKKTCLKCHAPTTLITGDFDAEKEITMEGVTCHFCHSLRDAHPNSDPENPERFDIHPGKTIMSPKKGLENDFHTTKKSPLHKKSELCAGCHEFSYNGIKLMSTYSEWLDGPYSAKGIHCQNCHMIKQKVGRGTAAKEVFSHYLAGGHSVTQIKKAVKVNIVGVKKQKDRFVVDLLVENVGSGHSVPTGIPTRKLILTCEVNTGDKITRKKKIIYEKVIFDAKGRELKKDSEIMLGLGVQIVKDNRIAPGEARKEKLVFYIEPKGEILVSVKIEYAYHPKVLQEVDMKIEMSRAEKVF